MLVPDPNSLVLSTIVWSAITIGLYLACKRVYGRWQRWWTAPLALTPLLVILVTLFSHTSYQTYIGGTRWLVTLLGPCVVAFAIPIYEKWEVIRKEWPVLVVGAVVGSAVSIASAWMLSSAFGLTTDQRLSLLPRSVSTPFAMDVSRHIGGTPELTAVFVIITGVFGAAFGETLFRWLPISSTIARGALFGAGAHGAGVAKAHEVGREEGSVAGLMMVFMGLLNVVCAPLLAHFMK